MYKVAILSQKGGTGKTTTSLHLAVAAERAGKPSVVIDLDPQASAAGWKDSRKDDAPVVVAAPPSRLSNALQAAERGGVQRSHSSTQRPTPATSPCLQLQLQTSF